MTTSKGDRGEPPGSPPPREPHEPPAPLVPPLVPPLIIGGEEIPPGTTRRLDLPAARLPTHQHIHVPVVAINGRRPGPRIWLSAAVHGDELNGVEIIRQVVDALGREDLRGGVLAVPIVNVLGFLQQSRYLPDRRDLNRSFPGSRRGSLAARIAHLFMTEVVARCQYGIDLHTGSYEKTNYPQIRANLHDRATRRIAEAFGAPVMVHSVVRDGSLRGAASARGIPVLVYEGGEPLRFNLDVIETGVRGVLGVLRELGMLGRRKTKRRSSLLVTHSSWVRARRGGLLRIGVGDGELVEERQELGTISDPFGEDTIVLRAPFAGLVLGKTNNPIVHDGDAVVHLGEVSEELPSRPDAPAYPGDPLPEEMG